MADFGGPAGPGRRTGVFDEIRRQMEEMLGGTRPPRPSVLPGSAAPTTRRGGTLGQGEHFGLAMTTMFGYWMLPIVARRKRRRRRMRARQAAEQQNTTQQDQ